MLPFIAAAAPLISTAADVYNTAKTNKANKQIAAESNAASAAQAEKQMQFQSQQSDTAHQREVTDLRKAGLNPILSATGGAGASTPSGAQGSISTPTMQKADLSNLGKSVESALSAATAVQGLKNLKAQEQQTTAQTANTSQDTMNKQTQNINAKVQSALMNIQLSNNTKQQKLLDSRRVLEQSQIELDKNTQKYDHYGDRALTFGERITDLFSKFIPGGRTSAKDHQPRRMKGYTHKNAQGETYNLKTGEIYD